MPEYAHLVPGQIFAERYAIEQALRSGGMGAVYVARHTRTHERVALKVMRPEIVAEPTARTRFEQEARVSSLIGGAGVVKVIDAGLDAATGMPFLVMELLRGSDLGDLVRARGALSSEDVVHYLTQVARTLDRAHAAGVVHRDLKPENLFLAEIDDEPPRIKILDFGIAKLLFEAHARTTMAGGTPLYMAPEQTKRTAEIGPHTDVWAFGLIAYTLRVGAPYWEAADLHQLYGEILSGSYESPRARGARRGIELPPAFDAWFFRCVHADPAARFQRAGDAAAALALALATTPSAAPPGIDVLAATEAAPANAGSLPAAPRSSRRTRFVVAGGAVAIIGAAAAMLGIVRHGREERVQHSAQMRAQHGIGAAAAASGSERSAASRPTAMTLIPGGSYEMGETHASVAVRPFYFDVVEVTVQAYEGCVESGACSAPNSDHPACNYGKPERGLHPVNCVDFEQATAYCAKYGKRLPSEPEWEWAARSGPKGWAYPWGNAPPTNKEACWNGPGNDLGTNRRKGTCHVGSFLAGDNAWEVHDLAGNVWEWTTTEYESTGKRVVRGGSWYSDNPGRMTASFRYRRERSERDILLGFRCAKDSG